MKNIAIITGASSGFGKDYATEIDRLREVDEIYLLARREEKLIETASLLKFSKPVIYKIDLINEQEILSFSKKISQEKVCVKYLVNNAGFGKVGLFDKIDYDFYSRMIDLNVKAVVSLTHKILPLMSSGSSIINISSAAAFSPLPYFNIYAATKVFVLNFSNALKIELENQGIKVLAVCPGPAETEFFDIQGGVKTRGVNIAKSIEVVKLSLRDLKYNRFMSVYGFDVNILRLISFLLPRNILSRLAGVFKSLK
ncbi:MAG: SDR family NAD(P)-dependent oxidoreductase [Candidatus Delongbacteria bacterium]|nr:SDR family NAD(P)-dependent oxidoreductase [Candidatus Delongbacteria bacterium]MBN2834670.1 SDR family NAD(P)-dependent oxidoreductase [Candidatus Delongbacteria bacterium]